MLLFTSITVLNFNASKLKALIYFISKDRHHLFVDIFNIIETINNLG